VHEQLEELEVLKEQRKEQQVVALRADCLLLHTLRQLQEAIEYSLARLELVCVDVCCSVL